MGNSQTAPSAVADAREKASNQTTDNEKRRHGSLHATTQVERAFKIRRREEATDHAVVITCVQQFNVSKEMK